MTRIYLLVIILFISVLPAGCMPEPHTRLTIVNNCGEPLELVEWGGYYFCNGEVWDNGIGMDCSALLNKTSVTREVNPGTDNVSFWLVDDPFKYHTQKITVHKGQELTFVFPPGFLSNGLQSRKVEDSPDKKSELLKMTGAAK